MLEQSAGIVRCFDPKTGELLYQQRLPQGSGFAASPWVNDGKICLLDDSGITFVIELGPEFKLISSNRLNDEIFWSSAAVSGDQLLLRGQQRLYCIRNSRLPSIVSFFVITAAPRARSIPRIFADRIDIRPPHGHNSTKLIV